MKRDSSFVIHEPLTLRGHYNLMKKSFGFALQGEARNLSKSEIDAVYEWRIANLLINDNFKPESSFTFDEYEAFVNSCGKRKGLSEINLKRVNGGIKKLHADTLSESNDMWRSTEERRRHDEALERFNNYLSVHKD